MLDSDFLNRAAPPGSMRYFALLYTPVESRDLMSSLFVLENEIRTSALAIHEVAHTRLQWWRGEIDRLVNKNAQHPATKVLQTELQDADFSVLHETMSAADMDLARMTYHTKSELDAYLDRSGGTLFALAAPEDLRPTIRSLGALIRRVETLRDLHADVRAGRIYWPLDELAGQGIAPEALAQGESSAKMRSLLAKETERVVQAMQTSFAPTFALTRPLSVLLALHQKLAELIARSGHNVFDSRHELGALAKNWSAWRAARRS